MKPAIAMLLVALAGVASCSSAPHAAPAVVKPIPEPRVSQVQIEPWTFEGAPGRLIQTNSYRLFTTLRPGRTTERLPIFLEAALTHYTSALGSLPEPPNPMETYVMETRPQWARLTQRTMGSDADVYLRIQRGGFSAQGRAILFYIGPRDTLAIAAHEGWHQYTQTVFQQPLPIWLEEGIACYMEGFRWSRQGDEPPAFLPWANPERYDALRDAGLRGRLLPLDKLLFATPQELMVGDGEDALAWYAQVWALVHCLNEGGGGKYAPALGRIVRDAANGSLADTLSDKLGRRAAGVAMTRRRGPDVLRAYLGRDYQTLQGDYDAFVRSLLQVGSKQRIVQGLSPVAPTP